MRKALAEIIAGLIPCKMARNQWRGRLRYGLRRGVRLRREIKQNQTRPEHYLAVCAIAKDEGPYFAEWLDWHISQGVEKFYVYDNGSTDCTRRALAPYVERGIVDLIDWPGHRMQIAAYDDCLERHRYDTRWLAFIDLDEFIVPIKDKSITHFLHRMEHFSAVEINWLIYGSSGQKEKLPGTMMQRFRRHSLPDHILNRHVKSIIDPRRVYCMIGCHEAARITGKAADEQGRPLKKSFRDRVPQQQIIRVNHYATRSLAEFAEKQARGRASGRQKAVRDAYFAQYDLNDIAD